jgi:beta-galactosidase
MTSLQTLGLSGDAVKAASEWKQPGAPVALTLEADRFTITADGSDLSRMIVSAVDANGTAVDNCEATVTFAIAGLGQLIGDNPVKLRAGRMIILVQSSFVPGDLTITANSEGMRPAHTTVKALPVLPVVDMPADLAVQQPMRHQ